MQVYQYVVWLKKENEEKLITETPVTVLAKSEETVKRKAIRALSSEYDRDLDQVEVVVRPFS